MAISIAKQFNLIAQRSPSTSVAVYIMYHLACELDELRSFYCLVRSFLLKRFSLQDIEHEVLNFAHFDSDTIPAAKRFIQRVSAISELTKAHSDLLANGGVPLNIIPLFI